MAATIASLVSDPHGTHRIQGASMTVTRKQTVFDTDDFYTYGAEWHEEEYIGCGGEYCPGPCPSDWPADKWFADTGFTADTICSACKRGEIRTAGGYRPYGMEG